MTPILTSAIITITLAFVFYTVAVWSEKIKGVLTKKILILFWIGLIFDTIGTSIMSNIADAAGKTGMSFHMITGLFAIILMLIHAVWASFVIVSNDEEKMKSFHKFSFVVWCIWLVPYLSGMIISMR